MDGELPRRSDLPVVFEELDFQLACQAYLGALPLVSYTQRQLQHREVFTNFDVVHYVTYADRLGLITANATTPYVLNFIDLGQTGPLMVELPSGPTPGRVSDFWQREVGVMGEMGPDAGKGGNHLIVPPGQEAPDDVTASRSAPVRQAAPIRTPSSPSCAIAQEQSRLSSHRRGRYCREAVATPA